MQKKYIKFLICLLAFLLAGMFFGMNGLEKEEAQWETMQVKDTVLDNTLLETVSIQETVNNIYVHICGEVIKPGVYQMPEGSRVYELLALAGGATADGVPDAVNLADVLADGERIVIPTEEEVYLIKEPNGAETGLINLNTATLQQLMTLPGIGEAKAADIIRYRESNGAFKDISDIMKISGIKDALFQKIQSLITV
ncbi:MAG: hypothetical protein HFG39_01925 [Lachnospiraceae bacterium]|nr:hypothetical protein [Lachnospiraceae bacterium]